MSVIDRIAFYQNRRDEVPNQELAKALAEAGDVDGIAEIAAHLWDKNQNGLKILSHFWPSWSRARRK